MKIIGIVGSRRKKGNTYELVNQVLESATIEGAETQLIFLGDYIIRPCTGCEGCKGSFNCIIDDDFKEIVALINEADGIVIGSPTYWYNISGDMKIFFDRCYSLIDYPNNDRTVWVSAFEKQNKFGVPIAICEQHDEAMMGYTYETLKQVMTDLHIKVSGGVKAIGFFEAGIVKSDAKVLEKATIAGCQLIKDIKTKIHK